METMKKHGRRWLGILLSVAILVTMVVIASVTATGANFTQNQTITGVAPVDIPQITFLAPETIWLQSATTQGGTTNTIDSISNIVPGHQVGAENDARLLFSSPDPRVQLVQIVSTAMPQPAVNPAAGFPSLSMFGYLPVNGTNNHNVVADLHDRNIIGTALSPMETRMVTWTATFTIDGIPGNFTSVAYSMLWAPSTEVAGSVGHVGGNATMNSALGIVGLHSETLNTANRVATPTFFNDMRLGQGSAVQNAVNNDWQRFNYISPNDWGDANASFQIGGFASGNVVWGHGVRNITNGVHVAHGFNTRIHFGNMNVDQRMEGHDIPGFALTYFLGQRTGGFGLELHLGQGDLRELSGRFPGVYGTIPTITGTNPNMPGTNRTDFHTIHFTTSRLWNNESTSGRPDNGLWTHGAVVPFSVWHWVRASSATSETDTNNAAIAHHVQFGVNWIDKTVLRNQVIAASTQYPAGAGISDPASVTAHRSALQAAMQVLGTPNTMENSALAIPDIVPQGINVTATVQYMIRLPGGALRPATAAEVNFIDNGTLPNHEASITVPAGVANNVTIAPLNLGSGFQLSGIIALGAGASSPTIPANLVGFSWSDTLTGNATYILIYDAIDYLPTFTIALEQAGDDVGGDTGLTVMDTDLFTDLVDDGALDIPAGQQLLGWEVEVDGATVFIPYDTDKTIGQVLAMVSLAADEDGVIIFNAVVALPGNVVIVYRPNCTGVLAHGDFVRGEVPGIDSGTQGEDFTTAVPAANFVRPGHRFIGWSRLEVPNAANPVIVAGDDIELSASEAAVINLFAQWEALDFELVFDGVSHVSNVGEAIAVAAPTAPTGQQFLGWACATAPTVVVWGVAPTTMPNLQLTIAGLTVTTSSEDGIDYTAALVPVFATNAYRVMFLDAYGLAGMQVVLLANPITGVLHGATLAAGDVLADPVDPTGAREFRGWSTTRVQAADAAAVLVNPAATPITADTRFYAVWDYATFTVTWQYNGVTVGAPITGVRAGDVLTPPLVGPTGEEYAPVWWSVAGAGTLAFEGANLRFLAGAGNATLNATSADETPAPLRITINPNGGTMASGQTATLTLAVLPGGFVNLDVTQRGRELIGWMNGATDLGPVTTFEVNEDNLTLVAQWNDAENVSTAARVFPSFFVVDANGDEFELEYGIHLPAEGFAFGFPFGAGFPEETGGNDQWSFIRWLGQDGSIVTSACDVNFIDGEEIRAFYVRNFQVLFNPNEGEFTDATDETVTRWVTYGMTYGEMPAVEREGYVFVGWYDTADETGGTRYEANSRVGSVEEGATHQFAGGAWEVPVQETARTAGVLFARWVRIHECVPCENCVCTNDCEPGNCDCFACADCEAHECPQCECSNCGEECDCDDLPVGPCGRPIVGGECDCEDVAVGPCGRPIVGGECDCEDVAVGPCGRPIVDGCDCRECTADCSCSNNTGNGDCEDCDCETGRSWWQVMLAVLGGVAIGVMIPLLMFLGGRAMGQIFCWYLFGC